MTITRIVDRCPSELRAPTRGNRTVGLAAAVYVGAWIAGLLANSAQLAADASAQEARAYYADNATAVALQATLVHAVAGIALGVLSLALLPSLPSGRLRRTAVAAGLTAAVISVGQAVMAFVAVTRASAAPADWSSTARHAIDLADSVKLVLLALLVGSVSAAYRRAARGPRWLTVVGQVLVVLLLLGAASFVVPVPGLGLPLVLSLMLLLTWVGSVGVLASRGSLAAQR